MHGATSKVGPKFGWYKTALKEPAGSVWSSLAPCLIQNDLTAYAITHISENGVGTVVKIDFDDAGQNLQTASETMIMLSPDTRTEIAHVLTDLQVIMKTKGAEIYQCLLSQ